MLPQFSANFKKSIKENKYIFLILFFYFISRLLFINNFPLFNDESIYLDWGWRQIDVPGFLYYSLYDGKQPLVIWLFGISQKIISDPLIAGRIVSVLFGAITTLILYFFSKKLLNKKSALIISIFYVVIPIFVFYDRQALMESSLMTIGVSAMYLTYLLTENNSKKYAILLGLVLGLGLFIKSTSFIFLFVSILILIIDGYIFKKLEVVLKNLGYILGFVIATDFLLIINPEFWKGLPMNNRYAFSIKEIFGFPISIWISNLIINSKIIILNFSPLLFILSVLGIYKGILIRNKGIMYLSLWIILSIALETFLSKNTSQRYLVVFLPLLIIPGVYFVENLKNKYKLIGNILLFVSFISCLLLSLFLIYKPYDFIKSTVKLSGSDEIVYITGQTSGYGIPELYKYVKEQSNNERLILGVGLNTGNPESAMLSYFADDKYITVVYMDTKLMGEVDKYKCINVGARSLFISRDNQLSGLERFLIKKHSIHKKDDSTIGIYELRDNCSKEETMMLKIGL